MKESPVKQIQFQFSVYLGRDVPSPEHKLKEYLYIKVSTSSDKNYLQSQ